MYKIVDLKKKVLQLILLRSILGLFGSQKPFYEPKDQLFYIHMVKGVTKHELVENHYHQTIIRVENNLFSFFMMKIKKNILSYGHPELPLPPL